MSKLRAIFSIPELRQKILITLLFLAIYRIGYYVPLPFIDQQKLADYMNQNAGGAFGRALGLVSMFSGGTLSRLGELATAATARNVAVDPATRAVWTTYSDGKSSFAHGWTAPQP